MRISAAAALVIVVILGWITFGLEGGLASPSWADVLKQTRGVRVAKLDMRSYEGKALSERTEMYVQAPSTLRMQEYEVVDGQETATQGAIVTPEGGIRWHVGSGVAERVGPDNAYVAPASAAKSILGLLGMAVLMDSPEAEIDINQTRVAFVPVDHPHPTEPELRGYRLQPVEPGAELGVPMLEVLTFWFDTESNRLRRMSGSKDPEGYEGDWQDVAVAFEPALPVDWFDLKTPEGYANVSDGLRARLPGDVRGVYDKTMAARKAFGDYRALIWSQRRGWGLPIYRESRRGDQWRADSLEWTNDRFRQFAEQINVEPDDTFDYAWPAMMEQGIKPEMSVVRYGDIFAMVHYNLGGRGPRVSAQLQPTLLSGGYDNYWGQTLRNIAWPRWMDTENLHPHGRDVREPLLQWRLLPQDPAHPAWINIVAERDTKSSNYVRYTFDAEHGYVCVRQELREYGDQIEGWLVLELAQTREGKWYPRRVAQYTRTEKDALPTAEDLDAKYTYLVESGVSADEAYFAWPEGVPEPVDPFAGLKSRRIADTEKAVETKDYPPTAMGKYTYVPNRGLPRGFDDEATSHAHWQMTEVMRAIGEAANRYASDHNWQAAPDLSALIEGGYIKQDQLHNPLHPDTDPSFVYIHIGRNLPNRSGRLMLYELFDAWSGVVTVMFADGSFEVIHDKAEFNTLLEAATSPEEPKRFGE